MMEIGFAKDKHSLTVTFKGELDHHCAVFVREKIDAQIQQLGPRLIIFDFEKLEFMDSSGIGIIIGRYKYLTSVGARLFLSVPLGQVRRLIKVAGLDKLIPVYESVKLCREMGRRLADG